MGPFRMRISRVLFGLAAGLTVVTAFAAGPLMSQLNGLDIENPVLFWRHIGGGDAGKLSVGAGLNSAGGALNANVTSVFGRSGAVALQSGDVTGALGHSPAFSDTANQFQVGQNLNNMIAAQTAHDEIIGTDGVIAAGSTAFSSAAANFTNQDRNKVIIVNGAGAGGTDLITTIAAVIDAHNVTLANQTTYATPWWTIGRAFHASTSDVSASYAVGDTVTASGGTTVAGASGVFTIISLEVSTPTVASGGSGGTNGPCTVIGTTGVTRSSWNPALSSATSANGFFTASGTVSGGVLTGPLTIVQPGDYSTAPTVQSAEPVVPYIGCPGLTGATVSLKMGPHMMRQTTPGHYTALPSNPVTTTTNGSGAGATLNLWGLTPAGFSATSGAGDQVGGYWAYGTDDTAAINQAIAATQAAGGGTVVLPLGRSLMLGAFNIPYAGTTPPVQPPLNISGAGALPPQTSAGGYTSVYGAGLVGSMIDNRYAGGDTAGHVAKIDTRGMGALHLQGWSLVDWGTDNFLMFQTTNTWPIIEDMTFAANPTCFRMTCLQDIIRWGGISGAQTYSTASATGSYQANNPILQRNFFGHCREVLQLGSAANTAGVSDNQVDSTCGSWSTGAYHFYGAGAGNGYSTFRGGLVEMFGYPYAVYMDHVNGTNVANTFLGLTAFDGSLLIGPGKNGTPTLGTFYFDANSVYNVVIGAPEDDVKLSWATQAGLQTNTLLTSYAGNGSYLGAIANLSKLGVALPFGTLPTYSLDVGGGTGAVVSRLNGGNTNSNDGPCIIIATGGTSKISVGTISGCKGGAADATGVINATGGKIKFESFNVDVFTLDNGVLSMQAPFQLMNYTVSTLPTCNSAAKGRKAYVTDASAPTYGATLIGSGAVVVPAFCNGVNWVGN